MLRSEASKNLMRAVKNGGDDCIPEPRCHENEVGWVRFIGKSECRLTRTRSATGGARRGSCRGGSAGSSYRDARSLLAASATLGKSASGSTHGCLEKPQSDVTEIPCKI